MPAALTPAELLPVAQFVARFTANNGLPPSMREVANAFDCSLGAAWSRLWRCVDVGYLDAIERGPSHRMVASSQLTEQMLGTV